MTEKECAKLFNQGYILQRENPSLLASIMKGLKKDQEKFKVLKAGKEQYEVEQRLERIKKQDRKHKRGRSL